VLENKPN